MIIGFIGFGDVSQNMVKLISCEDITFITSADERSARTAEKITKSNIEVLDTFYDVARKSDILISANSPQNALKVAEKYAPYCRGIYLDLNNISPDTTFEISKHADNFVDGAVIGKIDSSDSVLYISGPKSQDLLFLNSYIETKIISDKIGDVSLLKLLRSTYTKTLSALLIESRDIALNHNLEDEFFDILSLTEGDDFTQKSLSRINNTLNNSKRKSEELNEIINYFDDEELIMVKAARQKLNR